MSAMAAVAFDTLAFARRLQSAGMTSGQAEVVANAIHEVAFEQLVTKTDLSIALKELEVRLLYKMGAMIAGSTALTITVLTAISHFH